MELDIEINNQTKNRFNMKLVRSVVSKTLKKSELKFLRNKNILVSVAIVPKKEIRRLNKIYRHKNEITDILSFSEYKNTANLKKEEKSAIFLGELIVCYDDIKEYAKKNKFDFKKELAKVICHGALHLLGFKHGKGMFNIQDNCT